MTSADYIAKWKTYWRDRKVCSRLVLLSGVAASVLAAWLHRIGCESLLGLLLVLFAGCSIGTVIFSPASPPASRDCSRSEEVRAAYPQLFFNDFCNSNPFLV